LTGQPRRVYSFRVEEKEFEELVKEAVASLPEWFAERLENVQVIIEDEPSGSLLKKMRVGHGSTLLGLYEGVPLPGRGFYYGNVLPDRILIFKGPILRMGGSRDEIRARVRDVVIHEIGHYFGLSDEEMRSLSF
jgi:predicted Zn-dependent protease with MMP-like domain